MFCTGGKVNLVVDRVSIYYMIRVLGMGVSHVARGLGLRVRIRTCTLSQPRPPSKLKMALEKRSLARIDLHLVEQVDIY